MAHTAASTSGRVLAGRTALVTGASSGIGTGIVRALSAAGAQVAMVGRNRQALAALTEEIRSAGGEALDVVADVTARGAAERIVETVVTAYGGIDCLVPNAGVFVWSPADQTTDEQWDVQLATNVTAPFRLTRAALPHLRAGSSIIFTGSNLTHHGVAGTAAHAASKGAVEAMARALAVELGPAGIRVNTIAPGPVRTPMTAALTGDPEREAAVAADTLVGRIGEVEDITQAVLFLASPQQSGYIAGATLIIDGGQVAR